MDVERAVIVVVTELELRPTLLSTKENSEMLSR